MPYLNIGSGNDLILEIPTDRTTNWSARFKANFATPVAEHDHTGTGRGRKLSTTSFSNDSITSALILLENDSYLRGRNQANTADVNIIKVNTSDKLALGVDLANLEIINNVYFKGRNNADSAYINILKIKTDDSLELSPATSLLADLTLKSGYLKLQKTFALLNNQTNTNVTGVILTETAGKSYRFEYSIFVDATADLIEKGSIEFSYDGTNWNQNRKYSHDDSLVTLDINATQLRYSNANYAGFSSSTLTYLVYEL